MTPAIGSMGLIHNSPDQPCVVCAPDSGSTDPVVNNDGTLNLVVTDFPSGGTFQAGHTAIGTGSGQVTITWSPGG